MITTGTPIDILEMARPDIEQARLRNEMISKLRLLKKMGKTNAEIMEVINKMDLPLGLHLSITGNFSKIIGGN